MNDVRSFATPVPAFNADRAWLHGPDQFPRFRVPALGEEVQTLDLADDELLVVVERSGERRALRVHDLAYHHSAQGVLAGEPFVVAF